MFKYLRKILKYGFDFPYVVEYATTSLIMLGIAIVVVSTVVVPILYVTVPHMEKIKTKRSRTKNDIR